MPRESIDDDRVRLTHMLESAQRAVRIADGLDDAALAADEVRLLAIVKSIEIIGEASTRVSETTRARCPEIDWIAIRGMRNRLIHGYDAIDERIVFATLRNRLPGLIANLTAALARV